MSVGKEPHFMPPLFAFSTCSLEKRYRMKAKAHVKHGFTTCAKVLVVGVKNPSQLKNCDSYNYGVFCRKYSIMT